MAITLTAGQQFGVQQILGGFSSNQAAQASSTDENSALKNASIAREQGAANEAAFRKSARRTLGFQRANLAASGVDISSGSPLDFLVDQVAEAETNALTIRHNADLQAESFEAQAAGFGKSKKAQKAGSLLQLGLGVATLFSDERLKRSIVLIGKVGPLGIYTWRWTAKGKELAGNQSTIGFIAQEVKEHFPEAVTMDENNFMKVDYELATERALNA